MLLFCHILTIVRGYDTIVLKLCKTNCKKHQNKAGRIITGDSYEIASDTVRTKLWWDTLKERREKQLETLMIQIMKGNSIAYLREFFYILF